MTPSLKEEIWAFDCEWAPDIEAGRLIYRQPEECPDEEVLRVMWEEGGATPDDPRPFLRMIYCRIVSIATLVRRIDPKTGGPRLYLMKLPNDPDDPGQREESHILKRFLEDGIVKNNPWLIGFNSRNSDLRILAQRAIVKGLSLGEFAKRLDAKPWASRDIDLMEMVAGFGKMRSVSLNDIATLSGIPGKLDTTGDDVAGLWYGGFHRKIVEYNCFDVLTTYLVWLRFAYFSGQFTEEEYGEEQRLVLKLIEEEKKKENGAFLETYLEAWRDLQARTGQTAVFGNENPPARPDSRPQVPERPAGGGRTAAGGRTAGDGRTAGGGGEAAGEGTGEAAVEGGAQSSRILSLFSRLFSHTGENREKGKS